MKTTYQTQKRLLIALSLTVIATGVFLHLASEPSGGYSHHVWARWAWLHTIASLALTIASALHIRRRKSWFKSLGHRKKSFRTRFRQICTLATGTLALVLLISGVIMVVAVEGGGSGIGLWHYVIGYVWAVFLFLHIRPKARK